jgi:sugar/nucleoside kinase (ribokinase family)
MTVAVLGEALIDFIFGEDGAYRSHLGGSPYNVAIGLARHCMSRCGNKGWTSLLRGAPFGQHRWHW